MSKIIVHIDLNAFFVRCEEIKDPSLENLPVAIGHAGRGGIISTCSYAARKFGIRSGMPTFKALNLCPSLILKASDFPFYRTMSHSFYRFVRRYTKMVEPAGSDELYADFTEQLKNVKDVESYFKTLQRTLFEETKLKCSIGVAPTKFLAKMGSDYQKPLGLTIIRRKDIKKILYPLSIDDFYGIGKRTCPRLKQIGINTIGDLAAAIENDNELLKQIMGEAGFEYVKEHLEGRGNDIVHTEPNDPKSIGNSSTLMHDTSDLDEIKQMIYQLSEEVSQRAKAEKKIGSTIQIVVKNTDFKSFNKSITFETPTNDKNVIFSHAYQLYESNFEGMIIRLVGVTLQNLVSIQDMSIQMTFFDYEQHEEESRTKLLINDLNRKMKKELFVRASQVKKENKK